MICCSWFLFLLIIISAQLNKYFYVWFVDGFIISYPPPAPPRTIFYISTIWFIWWCASFIYVAGGVSVSAFQACHNSYCCLWLASVFIKAIKFSSNKLTNCFCFHSAILWPLFVSLILLGNFAKISIDHFYRLIAKEFRLWNRFGMV